MPLTSNNSNAVPNFSGTISNPPPQTKGQALADAYNDLVNALRRLEREEVCTVVMQITAETWLYAVPDGETGRALHLQ